MSTIKQFVNKNLVAIVMVPSLILIHLAWNNLQNVESLVSKAEKKDLPIVIAAKLLTGKNAPEEMDTENSPH